MCQTTDHIILSETEKSRLAKCKCCGSYVLIYNNVHISFVEEEYAKFAEILKNLQPADFSKEHPCGAQNVLLRNPGTNMGVSFSESEVEDLLKLIREASLFEEIFSILYTK
ncbi:MAG: DUF6686 family protein [Cyclobacteriaceae bacterium]